MSDVWEQKYSVPPDAAALDYNGNGLTNLQKSLLGLDPRDPNARFQVSVTLDAEQNQLRLSFDTQFGKLYQLESSTDLQDWTSFGDLITGTGTLFETTTEKPPVSQIFYRCRFAGDLDADDDGLTAWEEQQLGTSDNNPDTDGDGISDSQEYQGGTDPTDYYNGTTPTIQIVGGDNQQSDPETFLSDALTVRVLDGNDQPLTNAPVTFTVTQSWGELALSSHGELQGNSLTVRTDANGSANVYYALPAWANDTSLITATVGPPNNPASVTFTESTAALPAPEAATEVVAIKNEDGTTTITWHDNSPNEAQFVIERQLADGSWRAIGFADANATSFTTSTAGQNFRVRAEDRYGDSSISNEANPTSTRYAIIDLGANVNPIRVTNSGYVLCHAAVPRRWRQGQFEELVGGDDPGVIGTSDINEQGAVVGAVLLYHPGTPSPAIGAATFYNDSPIAWYRNAEYGTRAAAKWEPTASPTPGSASTPQVNASLLPTPSFPFSIHDYTNAMGAPYIGTVNPSAARVIDNDQIYGWAMRDYQQRDQYPDADGRFPPTQWGSVTSGYDFISGSSLGDASLVLGADGFTRQGQEYYIQRSRAGTTIGADADGYASRYFINGLPVDFEPLNLNSHAMALMSVTQSTSYKFFLYDTSTQQRTESSDQSSSFRARLRLILRRSITGQSRW